MSLHQIFEILSVIGLITGGGILYVVSTYRPSQNQKRMMLICGAALIIYLGNFFSVFSTEYEALLRASQLRTVGHILLLMSFIMFMAGYCDVKVYKSLQTAVVAFNFLCAWACIMGRSSNIFYKKIEYVSDTEYPYIEITLGPLFILCRVINFAIILALALVIFKGIRKGSEQSRRRNIYVLAGTIAASMGDFITAFDIMPGYDFIAVGITICFGCMVIAIYKYGALDTMEVAKENLVEEISEGLVVVDADKQLVYANAKAKEIMPYLNIADVGYEPERVKEIFESDHCLVENGNVHYEAKVSELYENGSIRGYMAWLFDLSFINMYTQEVVALKEAAEAANQSKTSFLANMSHEIRTPMNAIAGFNELILKKSQDKEITSYATDIKTASNNLLAIINDILDISKIESGKMEIVENRYKIAELIEESIINIKEKAKEKGLEFILDMDMRLPCELYGDSRQIRNILINLMNNAVKYTTHGFIKVIVTLEEIRGDEAVVNFSVADSGIGIKEENLPKLFNKFEQLDSKKNSSIEGTGLGLPIVKGYTELMGGTITVDSEYGMGSTFTVTLNQRIANSVRLEDYKETDKKPSEDNVAENEENKSFKAPNARILVTDDNIINLKVSASLLGIYGIHVDTAESGRQAIEMCQKNTYDIIFMDHMMPEMDGVEAMKCIRDMLDNDNHRSCIIALTANAIAGVREMLEAEGFDGYVSKPIDIAYMEKILLKHLPQELVIFGDEGRETENHDAVWSAGTEEIKPDRAQQTSTDVTFEQCLEGFDVEQGIINCGGDRETYEEIVQIYYDSGESRIDEFAGFLASKDYKNYIIGVHGLKSSSASIGAMELSERAKTHELSGKEGNYEYLHKDFEGLVTLYRATLEKIGRALVCSGKMNVSEDKTDISGEKADISENKFDISEQTLNRAVRALNVMLNESDYDGMSRLIRELETCRLPEDVQKNIDSLKQAVDMEGAD